jgi:hypothetical protein
VTTLPATTTPTRPAPPGVPSLAELHELAQVAQMGHLPAAQRLRELFQRHGDELVALAGGDLAAQVQKILIRRAVPLDDALGRQALIAKVRQLAAELAGPSPTAIERLLAERAAICWLDVHAADLLLAERWGEDLGSAHATVLDRYRDRAHRRFLGALKALAQVRRLAVPVLQVNVATNQQVNSLNANACDPSIRTVP